ncbi:MAG: TfoX/Sxy family protein [SAR202 cluster bacterium]|nr:TfoX/Sxy family protein [SAR202 cluster bacterium]
MDNPNLDRLTTLLERVQPKLPITHQLEFRNVFGAVSGYVDGRIFISCGKFGVALKLPPNILDALFQDTDVERLRYFPKGHIKKEYAVLPIRILEDDNQFRRLVNESVQYAQSSSQ